MSIQNKGGSVFGEMSGDRNPFQESSFEGENAISRSSADINSIDQSPSLPKVSEIDVASLPDGAELKAIDEKTGELVVITKNGEDVLKQEKYSKKATEIDQVLATEEQKFANLEVEFNKIKKRETDLTPLQLNEFKQNLNNSVLELADKTQKFEVGLDNNDRLAVEGINKLKTQLEKMRQLSDEVIPIPEEATSEEDAEGEETENGDASIATNAENLNKEPDSFDAIDNAEDYSKYLDQLINYFTDENSDFSKTLSSWADKRSGLQELQKITDEINKLSGDVAKAQKNIENSATTTEQPNSIAVDITTLNLEISTKIQEIAVLQNKLNETQTAYNEKFDFAVDEVKIYDFIKVTEEIFAGIDRTKNKFSDNQEIVTKLQSLDAHKEKIAKLKIEVVAEMNRENYSLTKEELNNSSDQDIVNLMIEKTPLSYRERMKKTIKGAMSKAGLTASIIWEISQPFIDSVYDYNSVNLAELLLWLVRQDAGRGYSSGDRNREIGKDKSTVVKPSEFRDRFKDSKKALLALKKSMEGLGFKKFSDSGSKKQEIDKLLDSEPIDNEKVKKIFLDMYKDHMLDGAENSQDNKEKFAKIYTTALFSKENGSDSYTMDFATMSWFEAMMQDDGKQLSELWTDKKTKTEDDKNAKKEPNPEVKKAEDSNTASEKEEPKKEEVNPIIENKL